MSHDFERVVVCNEWPEIQTRHIFDTVFIADTLSELLIGSDPVSEVLNPTNHLRVRAPEGCLTGFVSGINQCAVRQNDSRADKHSVAVCVHTTIHARCVVADDTAHHRTSD